ncbi:MAG: hypothetical protein LBM07_06575 [Culturomica sp.]|jgi:hypothetical protein|nr:hypothetical protein [Culturomica sp.]
MSLRNTKTDPFDAFIESIVGMSVADIIRQDSEETERIIENKLGTTLQLGEPDPRIPVRGNPLLAMGRVIREDIDAEFNARFGIDEKH